jgi:anti-sigma B factor antagonist
MYIEVEYMPQLNRATLYLEGNFTAATHRQFEKSFEQVLSQAPVILLDLSEVKILDSTGLGALIRCLKLSLNVKARLILTGVQPSPRMVLELTRTDQLFEIYDSQTAAFVSLEMEAKVA